MKIQVVIEATSIQEYTEAIQALAAGYTVAPVNVEVPVVRTVKQEIESDVAEDKQIKYVSMKTVDSLESKLLSLTAQREASANKMLSKLNITSVAELKESEVSEFESKLNSLVSAEEAAQAKKAAEDDKPIDDTAAPKTEDKVSDAETKTPKYGFPAVKQIAMKLSKITDGKAEVKALLEHYSVTKLSDLAESQYDDFHADATQLIADHDNAPAKEDKPKDNVEDVPSDDKEITLEMIRSKAKELSEAGFKEEIKAALKEIGAPALTKIPKDQYASFYETMGNIQ